MWHEVEGRRVAGLDRPGWAARLRRVRRVELERPIPVSVASLTAFVRDGQLYSGNDAYGRDPALARALAIPDPAAAVRDVDAIGRLLADAPSGAASPRR